MLVLKELESSSAFNQYTPHHRIHVEQIWDRSQAVKTCINWIID